MSGGQLAHLHPLLGEALVLISLLILMAGMAQNLVYVVQLYFGYRELRERQPRHGDDRLWWLLTSHVTVPISLIVPAHNEEESIVDTVHSVLSLHYPQFEVVVVNDGSTDGTLAALVEAFDLGEMLRYYDSKIEHRPIRGLYGTSRHPQLLVIDKEQGGKADALNAGINLSRSPVFCAVDADSVLEPDSLLRAVQPFVDEPVNTVAVGGTIRVTNGCRIRSGRIVDIALPKRFLPLLQIVEYLRAFLIGRLGWSHLRSLMLISGAFGIFSRRIVMEVGGYSTGTVGEDLELVITIQRYMREHKLDYAIRFVPDPVCWTEAPENLRVLGRQRMRWQRGALETFFKHKGMLLNPRYGRAGIVGMGHVFLVDVLGPPLEVLGYFVIPLAWLMGVVSWEFFAAYLAVTAIFGVFLSVASLALEEMELRRFPRARDLVLLTLVAVAENFGYRQLCNLWRIGGWWQFLRKATHWN
jgi:cellulose synthase/poly-beta-1,6-N-acetylglucosamine synthase-like glycosyltransferase